jgi:hypothetical protein
MKPAMPDRQGFPGTETAYPAGLLFPVSARSGFRFLCGFEIFCCRAIPFREFSEEYCGTIAHHGRRATKVATVLH